MEQLKNRILNCTACDLYKSRNNAVWGEGNPNAEILLIGEAPGADEDSTGRPFVGKSGRLLEKILAACGFTRQEHVFMANVIRCRPPGNRVPTDEEVRTCIPFLQEQIRLVDPKIIIPLGATALKRLLNDDSLRITCLRGKWLNHDGRLVMPVYHPSALLRNPDLKRDTWEDFKQVIYKYRDLINPDHFSKIRIVMKGYTHIYTGNGKGKTTAAFGLALRAAGAGKKIFIAQFVKGKMYSEIKAVQRWLPSIEVKQYGLDCFIVKKPTKKDIDKARQGMQEAKSIIASGEYDVVILDEITIALYYNLFPVDEVVNIIKNKPDEMELIITGRYASNDLIELADLVTEMKEISHYYNEGVEAREGIEY